MRLQNELHDVGPVETCDLAWKAAGFATSRDEVDGRVGGIYSPMLLRGTDVVAVPLPINFYFDETRVTPVGQAAMDELAKALSEQNVRSVFLVGHADPRGDRRYNLELSRRRAEAVRDYLRREKGITAEIEIEGRGSDEAFDVSVFDRPLSKEEVYSLDRRVEWVRKGRG
jgi:outer membrane protein OmpA-like peptidoglycan-associated protein